MRGGRGTRRGRKGGGPRVEERDREVRREQRGDARRRGLGAWPGRAWPGDVARNAARASRTPWFRSVLAGQVHFVRWAEGTAPRTPAGPARPGVRTPRIPRERGRPPTRFRGRPGRVSGGGARPPVPPQLCPGLLGLVVGLVSPGRGKALGSENPGPPSSALGILALCRSRCGDRRSAQLFAGQ